MLVELRRCSVHSDRDSGQPDRTSRRPSSRDAICAALQVKKVIAALKGNAQTMTLVLSNNRISDAGCIALATALAESAFCPQLLSLDLRGNARVSDAGIRILVRTLPAQYPTVAAVCTCALVRAHDLERQTGPSSINQGCPVLQKDATLARPNLQAWTGTTTGAQDPDAENMEEVFKQVTLQEESMESVAQPSEQWDALRVALRCMGPSACSRISEVMHDITDSVTNELVKEVRRCLRCVTRASVWPHAPPCQQFPFCTARVHQPRFCFEWPQIPL